MNILKKILLAILIFILLFAGYGAGIYLGYFPVPKLITNQIAKKLEMTQEQAETLNKVINLNQVLLRSENKEEYQRFRSIIATNPGQKELIKFIVDDYEKLTEDTKMKIKKHLEIEKDDFMLIEQNLEYAIHRYEENKNIKMRDKEKVQKIIMKAGITDDFINKLSSI